MSGRQRVVSFAAMNGSEGLGYGTEIMLDGAYADGAKLEDLTTVRNVLEAIVAAVEPAVVGVQGAEVVTTDAGADGYSAALIQGETVAILHAFPLLRTVSLHLFSAHDLPLSATTRQFLVAFDVGRFQSSVRAFGQFPPRDPERLKRDLAGQRSYVKLRVTPAPTVTG